ncbi:MAG TPA: OmpA family protein [Pirellulales bacterium]|nr:OmpA family protein [Pirellulales bacterium]
MWSRSRKAARGRSRVPRFLPLTTRVLAFGRRLPFGMLAATLLLFLAGCSSPSSSSSWFANMGVVPRSRFDNLQAQNRTLAERASAQQAEIENLKLHTRNVENQLIRAEEDLARLDDAKTERHHLASSKRKHEASQIEAGYGGGAMPAEVSSRLAELADRYPSLHYDPESGVSKFDTDVLFDSGEARLNPSAQKMLGEFSDIFQAPEARDLKIMVVGHTDARGIKGREARSKYPNNWHLSASRAVSVLDCLRESGLPENRMGIAGFAQYQPVSPNDTAQDRKRNRRVEIFVIGPETPVVGWTETLGGGVYR